MNMKKTKTNNDDDRISSLPYELLRMITSRLPLEEAIRTSILSKRWHQLWHILEFNENNFVQWNGSKESIEIQRREFIEFSRKRCQDYHPGQSIGGFCLVFSNPGNYLDDLQELVKFAIIHNVKLLKLDFSDPSWKENSPVNQEPVFELPKYVYEYQDLELIELYSCKVRVMEFKNPGGIKSFSLGWTNLSNNRFNGFLAKCTSLERLSLKKCWNVGGLNISAPRLKSLVLDKCSNLNDAIDIDAKTMNFFKYSGEMISFNIEYLRTMKEAEIDFVTEEAFYENGDILYSLLNELWSSEVLSVCGYLLQVIPSAEEKPNLECVRHLKLKTGLHMNEYYGISYLLKSCPYIEKLTFDLSPQKIFEERATHLRNEEHPFLIGFKFKEYGPFFKCLKTLKNLEIIGFKGEHYESKALKYLINSGTALEKVCVTLSSEKGPNGMDMSSIYRLKARSLLSGPRPSRDLKLIFKN